MDCIYDCNALCGYKVSIVRIWNSSGFRIQHNEYDNVDRFCDWYHFIIGFLLVSQRDLKLPRYRYIPNKRRGRVANRVRDIMKYRQISLATLFLSLTLSILGSIFGSWWLAIPGTSLLLIFFILSFIFWRCPVCKRRLPLRFDSDLDLNDVYRCPYCKTKFLGGEILEH